MVHVWEVLPAHVQRAFLSVGFLLILSSLTLRRSDWIPAKPQCFVSGVEYDECQLLLLTKQYVPKLQRICHPQYNLRAVCAKLNTSLLFTS
jgi:hypothetical protein